MGRAKRLRKERAARRRARRLRREQIWLARTGAALDQLAASVRESGRAFVRLGAVNDQILALGADAAAALSDRWLMHGTPAQKRAVVRWRNRKALREAHAEEWD